MGARVGVANFVMGVRVGVAIRGLWELEWAWQISFWVNR